jgi:vacuolar protein sorting-associated protein 54
MRFNKNLKIKLLLKNIFDLKTLFRNFLPTMSSEIVHRVVEILKFFNTRTCQLVLGAGAMQVLIFCPNVDDL